MSRNTVPTVCSLIALLAPASAFAAVPDRYPIDQRELASMKTNRPEAFAAFQRGEAALFSGNALAAAPLLKKAADEVPDSVVAARRYCQALTDLGQRDAAMASCQRAVANGATPMDFRSMAGALMAGPNPPTTEELASALRMAARAAQILPRQPWPYAAGVDIAWRLGDDAMLEQWHDKLRRVSPTHFETARAERMIASRRASRLRWLGWLAIAAAGIGTLGHALRRARLRRSSVRRLSSVVVLLLGVLGLTTPAMAIDDLAPEPDEAMSKKFTVDDANPEASVPSEKEANADPIEMGYFMMDLGGKARKAYDRGDREAAIRYYRAFVKAVPGDGASHSKLCELYEATGRSTDAISSCRDALGARGVKLDDYARFVRLVTLQRRPLLPAEVEDIDAVAAHLREQPATQQASFQVECQLGAKLEDEKRLTECTTALAAVAPTRPDTIEYQWALALTKRDFAGAEQLTLRAEKAGVAKDTIERMQDRVFAARPLWQRAVRDGRVLAAMAAIAGAAALLLARLRRGRQNAPAV